MLDPRHDSPWHRCVRRPVLALFSTMFATLALGAAAADAVVRSCGPDPVANVADVLCAPPSGPCTATDVTVGTAVQIPDGGGCRFDLGGRDLVIERAVEATGRGSGLFGRLEFLNAGAVTLARRGKLKARGDFVQPNGFIVRGGDIEISATGPVSIDGVLDVSGDAAGEIRVFSDSDIALGAEGLLRGNGISSFFDEGERFADGAEVVLDAAAGSVTIRGAVVLTGQSGGAGGTFDIVALEDVTIEHRIDLTGGGSDGGSLTVNAEGDIRVTRSIDADSRSGAGGGGTVELFGSLSEGTVTVEDAIITLRGSATDEFAGDGGSFCIDASGDITLTNVVVRASAPPVFDGSGGIVVVDAFGSTGSASAAFDGDVRLDAHFDLRPGPLGGFGGEFDVQGTGDVDIRGVVDLRGLDTSVVDVRADQSLRLHAPLLLAMPNGIGSDSLLLAGQDGDGTLFVGADVLAGSVPGGLGRVELEGCSLVVDDGVTVDVQGTTSELILGSLRPMQIGAGSRVLAGPGGTLTIKHPAGADPVVDPGALLDPPPVIDAGFTPERCRPAVCGDGLVEGAEECDDGNTDPDDGCASDCTAQCPPAPMDGCVLPIVPARAALEIRDDGRETRDRVVWRWVKGGATTVGDFGDPTDGDDYAFCLYDEVGLVMQTVAPGASECDGGPCWSAGTQGFTYDDSSQSEDGIDSVALEAGADGEARIVLTARGPSLPLPALPLATPLRAQLQGSHGHCWEATYSAADRNTSSRFEAHAD